MDVESADVDEDGDLDIIVAGEATRNLLFFNDGNGVFSEDPEKLFPTRDPDSQFLGQDSEDIAIGDFDNDTHIDIIFVSEDTQYHEFLVGDGDGNFYFAPFDFQASAGNAIATLDLNGDNYLDVIIGNTGQNHVYINNQDLTFTLENDRWPVNTEGTQDFKLVDLDGDLDLDIVEGIDIGTSNILINNDGFFAEENTRLPVPSVNLEIRKVAIGDINGDDAPDIFMATVNFTGPSSLQNRIYLNDGNGFFADISLTSFPGGYVEQTLDGIFYDYDMDNDLDLITSGFFTTPGNNFHAFENDGAGVFNEVTDQIFEPFFLSDGIAIHSADFNGDEIDDLYFGGTGETDDLLFHTGLVSLVVDQNDVRAMSVFPNPVKDKAHISCPGVDQTSVLTIHDARGKIVFQDQTSNNTGLGIDVDVSEFSPGHYTIQTRIDNDLKCAGKMLVID